MEVLGGHAAPVAGQSLRSFLREHSSHGLPKHEELYRMYDTESHEELDELWQERWRTVDQGQASAAATVVSQLPASGTPRGAVALCCAKAAEALTRCPSDQISYAAGGREGITDPRARTLRAR